MSKSDNFDYFGRFAEKIGGEDKDDRFLVLNSMKGECQIGLVHEGEYCSLGETDTEAPVEISELRETLEFFSAVISGRVSGADK